MSILRDDGTVVSWGGEVEGPKTIYSPLGTPLAVSLYTAEIGVQGEAEVRKVAFFVTAFARREIELRTSRYEDSVRQALARYLDSRIRNSWIPQNDEYFMVSPEELIGIYNELQTAAASN